MMFAGSWNLRQGKDGSPLRIFAINTINANVATCPIHDRMPAIAEPDRWPLWRGNIDGGAKTLLRPASKGVLRCWTVSRRVNIQTTTMRNCWIWSDARVSTLMFQ